jgi:prepilin-type N-terminal cleavage/methylation domain-containing protein
MIHKKNGFTAIELMISLAILAISLTSIYSLYMSFIRTHTSEGVKVRVQQNVRSSLDMMVRDIRIAGLDPEITDDFGIIAPLNPQRIQFTADRDMDGQMDEPNQADGIEVSDLEQMAYEYNGTDTIEMVLFKSDGTEEMRATLVDNVSDLTFTYLDANDATTSIANDVRSVEINMTIQRPAGRGGVVSRTLIKRVKCRNLAFH